MQQYQRAARALDDWPQVQRVRHAQIGVAVAKAGVELDRQLLGLGRFQGQPHQIIVQRLHRQPHLARPPGLLLQRPKGPRRFVTVSRANRQAGAVGDNTFQGHVAIGPGPAYRRHVSLAHLLKGIVLHDQLLGQHFQPQHRLHPAGQQRLQLGVGVAVCALVAVVAQQNADIGRLK